MTYRLLRGIYKFQRGLTPSLDSLYDELYKNGQKPSALLVGCADSRLLPESLTQIKPGEVFFHRNVGNLIPVYSEALEKVNSESSAIEYAVQGLGVQDIIICGHSDCGAMKNKLAPSDDFAITSNWVREQSQALEEVEFEPDPNDSLLTQTAQRNVVIQIQHLRTYPSVRKLESESKLQLHGWYFDMASKSIQVYDVQKKSFISFNQALQKAMLARREVVVRDVLLNYLQSLPRPQSAAEISDRADLLQRLQYNLKPIWAEIREDVFACLNEEFADMYTSNEFGLRAMREGAVFCKLSVADKMSFDLYLNHLQSLQAFIGRNSLFNVSPKPGLAKLDIEITQDFSCAR